MQRNNSHQHNSNEMVSLGDTAISLHILQPSKPIVARSVQISIFLGRRGSQNPKCQDLSKIYPNFNLGEGCFGKSKPKVPRSVQISMGGGGCSGKSKPKVPRSVQISIWGEGGVLNQIPEQGCSVQLSQKFLEA